MHLSRLLCGLAKSKQDKCSSQTTLTSEHVTYDVAPPPPPPKTIIGASRPADLDCLIIGAGFGGCYQLKLLRDAGFRVKAVDAASHIGGVWAWNRYPGARVDIEMPFYGFSDPKLWSTWNWTQRFPGCSELLEYFEHVDRVWQLGKDIELSVTVTNATYNTDKNGKPVWVVKTSAGHTYRASFLICATGTAYKQHIPKIEGLTKYKGTIHHSSQWPKNLDITGKRIAVVGAGSTGVQVVQEAAKVCPQVTQFIRTPNIAFPMHQRDVSRSERYAYKPLYQHAFAAARTTNSGLPLTSLGLRTFGVSDEERRRIWEEGWERGGFNWSLGVFTDTVVDKEANRAAYDFWAEKTRARITDPQKRELLAPLEPPYYINTKRPSLESDYYEMADRENVRITNSPIVRLTERGVVTADGREEEFDIIAMCTGYDAITGGLMTMNIKGKEEQYLHDKWSSGVATYLGVMSHGFPNMFMLYGPQAPTSLTNGPAFLEIECEYVRDLLVRLRDEDKTVIGAKREEEDAWRELVLDIASETLAIHTDSWWMGANIPGKRREYLLYMGGIPSWHEACREGLKDWKGFDVE